MQFSASSQAESTATSLPTATPGSSPPTPEAPLSTPAHDTLATQWLTSMQDTLQRYMQERFKTLEQQCTMEQQRQRDRLEEKLQHVEQNVAATVREQQQQQQSMATAARETLEQMRREFAAALQHLSRDITHALRQTEEQTRRALDNLRTEILQLLLEHDPDAVKRQMLSAYSPLTTKPLQSDDGNHRP